MGASLSTWPRLSLSTPTNNPARTSIVHRRGLSFAPMKYQNLYERLLDDVRQLKADLETLAAGSSLCRDAYFDAADMTKFVLEKDETRTQK